MPITELAQLSYKTIPQSDKSTIHTNLRNATCSQAIYSKHPVALLECHEDPNLIYLVGGWDSADQHMNEWIPSSVNQELLKLLGGDVDVKWMFHLSCEPGEVVGRVVEGASGRDEDIIAIGRHFVKEAQRDEFERTWKGNIEALEGFIDDEARGREKREGGWRLDWGYDPEHVEVVASRNVPLEFVLFMRWATVQKHLHFAQTEGFQRYGKIRDFISGAEIRHGKVMYVARPRQVK